LAKLIICSFVFLAAMMANRAISPLSCAIESFSPESSTSFLPATIDTGICRTPSFFTRLLEGGGQPGQFVHPALQSFELRLARTLLRHVD
jgi:hypothetical protein